MHWGWPDGSRSSIKIFAGINCSGSLVAVCVLSSYAVDRGDPFAGSGWRSGFGCLPWLFLIASLDVPPRSGSGLLRSIFTTAVHSPVFPATYCAYSDPFHVRRRVQVADISCSMMCREVSKLPISVGEMSFVSSIFIYCRSVRACIVSSRSLSMYLL